MIGKSYSTFSCIAIYIGRGVLLGKHVGGKYYTMHQDSTAKKTSFQAAGDGACTGTTKQRWYWEEARKKKAGKQKDQTATKWNSTDKWHACSRLLRKGSIGMQNLVTHATTEKYRFRATDYTSKATNSLQYSSLKWYAISKYIYLKSNQLERWD